jgi:hypothetical protein
MTNCLECRCIREDVEDHVCSYYCGKQNFSLTGKRLFWRVRFDWDCEGFEECGRIKWAGIGKSRIKYDA